MHYGCKKMGQKRGKDHRISTSNESILIFRSPNVCAKFHQNRTKIATVGARTDRPTERPTDRQMDASSSIICPVLCSSNGTDKKKINLNECRENIGQISILHLSQHSLVCHIEKNRFPSYRHQNLRSHAANQFGFMARFLCDFVRVFSDGIKLLLDL